MNLQTLNCKVTQVNMKSQPSLMRKKNEVLIHHLPKFKSQTCSQVLLLRKNNSPASFHQLSSHRKVEVDCPHTKVKNIGHFVLEFNLLLVSSNQVTNTVRSSQKFFTMLLLVEKPKSLEGEVLSQNLGPRRLKFRFEVLL